jgi:xanthine dehydrogenase small subunit
MKQTRDTVFFFLNGQLAKVSGDEAFMTLAEWLRKRARLTGTKIVCAEGDCGACTVVRAFEPRGSKKKLGFTSMNSCIASIAQMDGSHLVTVEGLKLDEELAPAQTAMRVCHGSQCGFCTPGFVMAITGALEVKPTLDRKTAANQLTGNLCRCTGYSPILDAAEAVVASPKHNLAQRYLKLANIKKLHEVTRPPLKVLGTEGQTFFAPEKLGDACTFLAKHKDARLISAGTDLGVQTNKGKAPARFLVSLVHIPELYQITSSRVSIVIGARVTLTQVRAGLANKIPEFARFLDIFASPQIKNVATLIGNLANASPIGDTLPFLLASDAVVHTARHSQGKLTRRNIVLQDFFTAYKQTALKSGELITAVEIPLRKQAKNLRLYKVSQRKDLDISAVSAALNIEIDRTGKIAHASLALGGVAATPIRLNLVEKHLLGQTPTKAVFDEAADLIDAQLHPLSDARGSDSYRRVLISNIFHKYVHEIFESPKIATEAALTGDLA